MEKDEDEDEDDCASEKNVTKHAYETEKNVTKHVQVKKT